MSPICLICIGFLLFANANGKDILQKDAPKRVRRSLAKLYTMVGEITGREGTEFLKYGNWCGLGGSGKTVDPVDGCCQNHDICYLEIQKNACRDLGQNVVYRLDYNWKKDTNGVATCDENTDKCASLLCLCDIVLTNCLKENIQYFDDKNAHKLSFYELLQEANYIKNL